MYPTRRVLQFILQTLINLRCSSFTEGKIAGEWSWKSQQREIGPGGNQARHFSRQSNAFVANSLQVLTIPGYMLCLRTSLALGKSSININFFRIKTNHVRKRKLQKTYGSRMRQSSVPTPQYSAVHQLPNVLSKLYCNSCLNFQVGKSPAPGIGFNLE